MFSNTVILGISYKQGKLQTDLCFTFKPIAPTGL